MSDLEERQRGCFGHGYSNQVAKTRRAHIFFAPLVSTIEKQIDHNRTGQKEKIVEVNGPSTKFEAKRNR